MNERSFLDVAEHVILTKEERKKQARQEMKKIKKKYGLAVSMFILCV